jgi:hypothetical protein
MIYLSLGLYKRRRLPYRRSLQPSKEKNSALQNKKFLDFFLLSFVGNFCPSGSGYGSTDLIASGSNPDPKHCVDPYPDPKHCSEESKNTLYNEILSLPAAPGDHLAKSESAGGRPLSQPHNRRRFS